MVTPTSAFSAFGLEPFPVIKEGDPLADPIIEVLRAQDQQLQTGDIVVIASKVVSISEKRRVALADVTPTEQARELAAATGKPAEIVQLILDPSASFFLAGPHGPIIARHKLGYQLTSAGVDRDGDTGAWLLPADPDASARQLRDQLVAATGTQVSVVIADSDGRADRLGATVISLGAAGIAPLRESWYPRPHATPKRQEETFTDLVAAAAGIVLGQRGRGCPVVIVRGVAYDSTDAGVASMLHR